MTAEPTRASFTPLSGSGANQPIPVHFNPASLQIAITNTLEDKGQGKEKKQYVTKSSAKLTMDLIYDSTYDGSDVRVQTGKIAKLMEPGKKEGDKGAPPSVVLFEWGTFKFQGLVESYKETLDFFAPTGVPLRASINLTLASQDKVFESLTQGSDKKFEPVVRDLTASGESLTDLAAQAGNPKAGRALAADNGLETMRFPSGAIALSAEIQLSPPVAFASGGAGFGAGLSAGISGGGSAGFGISGGVGISVGASAGIDIGAGVSGGGSLSGGAGFGTQAGAGMSASAAGGFSASASGQASAGMPASEGAFAGLRTSASVTSPPIRLDPGRLTPPNLSLSYATGPNASFQVGGRADVEGSGSLKADVGANASLQGRIQFT